MGMVCCIGQITEVDLEQVIQNPKRTELLVNDGEFFEQPKTSFFKALFSKANKPKDTWKPDLKAPVCDLDKAWHGIHFALTGDAEGGEPPLNFIMTGGTAIGDDIGYGPIRILRLNEVKALKQAIEQISLKKFKAKLQVEAFNENDVYPSSADWVQEELDEWIAPVYEELRDFIIQAEANNKCLYIAIT